MSSLYHYCKFSTFLEKILPNYQLRLSHIKNTNDPKETRDMVFAFSYFDYYSEPTLLLASKERMENMDKGYNHEIKVPTVTFNPEENTQRQKIINDKIKNGCKILCFSTDKSPFYGYEYSRMWAMYGENHKGVCIQINEQKFIEKNPDYVQNKLFRSVKYFKLNVKKGSQHLHYDFTKEKPKNSNYLDYFRMKHKIPLFFTKYEEWKSENEKRLIYFSNTNEENEFCSIADCIEKVHLGLDFNDVYIPAIEQYVTKEKIYKVRFNDVRLISTPICTKIPDPKLIW